MRFLLINGSSSSEHTCPGEMSKSYRMMETIGAYYPEANVLNAIDHHDELSKTPASEPIPVPIEV